MQNPWLVGCGSADVTGEPWDNGMMGYGMRFQRSTGIHLRQRSRAFALQPATGGRRVVYVVVEVAMVFANVRAQVLQRLGLPAQDVLLTATHTHAAAGGSSCYRMYGTTNGGLRRHTCQALVDGIVESVEQALADLAPGRVLLSRGELHGASVNRSPQAFGRNPPADRAHFPDAVDPATTVLRFERAGRIVGAVHWFATHGTSLTNRNTLLSGDNKGYAALAWEGALDGAVAACAQTNAGDMSPNVPDARRGPTPDEVENTRAIGEWQLASAVALVREPGVEVRGGLDSRLSHVDLPGLAVGRHRLGGAVLGAAFGAGTREGPGLPQLSEGVDANRLLSAVSALAYRLRPAVRAAQAPKAMLVPVGALGWVASRVPVQLVRIGPLVLVALAQEVTVVAGLRLRRVVAEVLGVPLADVLVQGYANDYAGYVTTPEEYDAQRYEGGHTMYGRYLLPAYEQEVRRVAEDLRDGRPSATAGEPRLPVPRRAPDADPVPGVVEVSRQPLGSYAPGDVVHAELAGDDPRGRARARYLKVQRQDDPTWVTVADEGAWSTTVRWRRDPAAGWRTAVTWRVPAGAAGRHRLVWVDAAGTEHPTGSFTLEET